jgi:hypothetical protein
MAASILTKKSQIWGFEFFIGFIIFMGAIFLFYNYSNNLSNLQEVTAEELIIDGKSISNYLMSAGLPSGWNASNVSMIGLTDGFYHLNVTKLASFSEMDYGQKKNLLSSVNDFLVFFQDRNGTLLEINGIREIGKPGVTIANLNATQNPADLLTIYRFVMYNSTIVRMGIYVW